MGNNWSLVAGLPSSPSTVSVFSFAMPSTYPVLWCPFTASWWCASQCLCSPWTCCWTVTSPTGPLAAVPPSKPSTMSNHGAHQLFTHWRLPLLPLCLTPTLPDRLLLKTSQMLWSSVPVTPLPLLPSMVYHLLRLNQISLTYPPFYHSCLPNTSHQPSVASAHYNT